MQRAVVQVGALHRGGVCGWAAGEVEGGLALCPGSEAGEEGGPQLQDGVAYAADVRDGVPGGVAVGAEGGVVDFCIQDAEDAVEIFADVPERSAVNIRVARAVPEPEYAGDGRPDEISASALRAVAAVPVVVEAADVVELFCL